LALAQLGRDRDDVAIEILINGNDEEEALVRVSVVDDEPAEVVSEDDRIKHARVILEELLDHMDISGYVTAVRSTAPAQDGGVEESITLHVEGADEEAMGTPHRPPWRYPTLVAIYGQFDCRQKQSALATNHCRCWQLSPTPPRNARKYGATHWPNASATPVAPMPLSRCQGLTDVPSTLHCAVMPPSIPKVMAKANGAKSSSSPPKPVRDFQHCDSYWRSVALMRLTALFFSGNHMQPNSLDAWPHH
jgi:hypothetical protein